MSKEIIDLKPNLLWQVFYDLTQIPRPSKKELKASLYVKAFGESLGMKTQMDAVGNVIISKPATPGFEDRKGVILQAHIDMVPQANSGSSFNFETDPIDAYVDGEWVTARGTTLGADNGIGVATALAILKADNIQHGPIEVLITIDEETGMTGAFELKAGLLEGDILINLDSEDEHDLSVGCAGGLNVNFNFEFEQMSVPEDVVSYNFSISGLKGGHSGLDIHLGRANACKLTGFALKKFISKCGAQLASIQCGNMRNAIPREGLAQVVIPTENRAKFEKLVDQFQEQWFNEYGGVEVNMKVEAHEVSLPQFLIEEMVQDDLVNAICAAPNAVIRMSDSMSGVVETSTNLSIVSSSDSSITGMCLVRSFVDSAKDEVASSLESCFRLAGARVTIDGTYPGWKPNPNSEILNVMKANSIRVKGTDANIVAMHAGLECGILGAAYPHWDMISVGPTIRFPHSPDEKVHIKSVENFWEYMISTLREIPLK